MVWEGKDVSKYLKECVQLIFPHIPPIPSIPATLLNVYNKFTLSIHLVLVNCCRQDFIFLQNLVSFPCSTKNRSNKYCQFLDLNPVHFLNWQLFELYRQLKNIISSICSIFSAHRRNHIHRMGVISLWFVVLVGLSIFGTSINPVAANGKFCAHSYALGFFLIKCF